MMSRMTKTFLLRIKSNLIIIRGIHHRCYLMIRDYSLQYLSEQLLQHYGLKGKLSQMAGFIDHNYVFQVGQGGAVAKYTVKISSKWENERLILLQNHVFKELEKQPNDIGCELPRLVPTLDGKEMLMESNQEGRNFIRVITYLEGEVMWDMEESPMQLFDQAGDIAAKLSLFLSRPSIQSFGEQVEKQSAEHFVDITGFNQHCDKYFAYLDEALKPMVAGLRTEFNNIQPILAAVPKQVIHNDICLSNILVCRNEQKRLFISGVIDFGDMIYTHRIIELIILCARNNIYQPDPLRNIFRIVAAYNRVRKLTEAEKVVLFPMIKVRLAYLTLLSSFLATQRPEDLYVQRNKSSQTSYLCTFTTTCSNEEFLARLEATLQNQ